MTNASATAALTVVNSDARFPRVRLVEPASSGYLLLAAEVDRRPPFLPNSRKKHALIARCKRWCRQLEADPSVVGAVVFDALVIPPGRGEFIEQRRGAVHVARFDLAILVETASPEAADVLGASPVYAEMERSVRAAAGHTHSMAATNARRIGSVDHTRRGVFLFNYFFADDAAQNLAVWEYTAGWFQQETGLDNSTVLLPAQQSHPGYTIINHCRWDRPRDVLPSLLLKRSFRAYVLANFAANRVAAIPILYRLA